MLIRVRGVNTTTKRNPRTGEVTRYYYHRRTGTRLPGGPDSVDFALAVAQLEAMPVGAPPEEKTFKALIQKYLASTDFSELASSTRAEYRRHIKYVEPVLGPFIVRSIRPRHVEGIKQKFAGTPVLAKAIGRTISVLLGYAASPLEWIPMNPLVASKRGGAAKRKQKLFGYKPYEEAEIATFREKNPLGSRARLAFEIALGTALRREDLCEVPAAALTGETFSMVAGKNSALLVLPVTKAMKEAHWAFVKERAAEGLPASKFALCSERGTKLHKRTVSADLELACKAAGFGDKQRLHALRYTAATRIFEAGFSYQTVQELTGHRMADMAKHYTEQKRRAPIKAAVFDAADLAMGTKGDRASQ